MILCWQKPLLPKLQIHPHNGAVVKLTKSEKTFTVSDLQRGAIASGKKEAIEKFKEYCKANNIQYDENMLDLAPIERYPAPVVKNGKVVSAETALLRPTSKPNGKVVVLNPGHGGYRRIVPVSTKFCGIR